MSRRLEWILALVLAAVATLAVLWPRPLNPGDLRVDVSVREVEPLGELKQQQVELTVRWHWVRPPRPWAFGETEDRLVVDLDPRRWGRMADGWRSSEEDALLEAYGERSESFYRIDLTPGVDGEEKATLLAVNNGARYHADELPLRVVHLHLARSSFAPPRWSWVQGTGFQLPIR
jgi:hypothetical protein